MNFNTDDPLADLLSDNSFDNDNFFDTPTNKNKLRIPTVKPKSKMAELKEETEPEFKATTQSKQKQTLSSNFTASSRTATTSTPRITKQKPSQSHDADFDDDDDLGFDPKKPKAAGGKANNFFDDLLSGGLEPKRPATAAPTTARRDDTGVALKPSMSRQSTAETTTDNSNLLLSQARPKTSTGRRSSGNSAVINPDPLGLFGGQTRGDKENQNVSSSGMSTPMMAKKRGTTADWLGLSAEPTESVAKQEERAVPESPIPTTKPTTPLRRETVDILRIPDPAEAEPAEEEIVPQRLATPMNNTTAQNIMLLTNMNVESNNAYNALQQQESQLALATQMKNQERTLLEMQRKQDTLLQQQDRQFQALLQQQLQRQTQMEEHIRLQQQRINTHIQLMMTQPAMMPSSLPERVAATEDKDEAVTPNRNAIAEQTQQVAALELVQMETDVKRLELEKLRLEELVENMKANYEREIEMIETSYKKQLKVLEEHLSAVETRLKTDLEEQKQNYIDKVETLEKDKQKLKSELESDIVTLKQEHEDELRKIRKSQEDDLEMMKEEHRRMLENIRQTKMLEFAAVQENGSYLETLKLASTNLVDLSGGLQGLREDMQVKIESLNREREQKIDARERKIEDAERRLKINEENADDEKRRLMELVSTLELQLSKLSKESAEENWLQRQKMATLEAEKAAFEREKSYAREQIERDEKRIADLKEHQLAETQKVMLQLQEERARLHVECTKIETERRLHPYNDLEQQHMEVEATLKIAQDATRQADAERERYLKLQRQLEQHKRDLVDKEHLLRAKEDELEQELSSFRVAERRSQESQHRARQAEQNFQAKIAFLQQRMRELGEKEANLAQERVLVAQERIALHNLRAKLGERKCALCKMSEQNTEITQMLAAAAGESGNGVVITVPPDELDDGNPLAYTQLAAGSTTNIVDRLLDENIAESYRKMNVATNANVDYWTESVLDDDSKKRAMHNLDTETFQYGGAYELLNTNLAHKF